MQNQKIAIIGAGICGLYLALKLSEKGYKVTVFEKNEKIGKEACSGLFSRRILDFIPQIKGNVQIENEIDYAFLHFPKKTIKIGFSKKFLVMNHARLDRFIFSIAKVKGVRIILSSKIDSLPQGFDRIIGCDGAVSKVRRLLGLKEPDFRLGIQGFIDREDFSNFVETWPTKSGFLWKIPRGKKTEYGIIEKEKRAKIILEEFLKERKINLRKLNSALIPQGLTIPFDKKVTLCGDAAGLTKPWSGGGVIWGLKAANILLENFPDFLEYEKEARRFFSPRFIFSKLTTFSVYFFGFKLPCVIPKNVRMESDFLV